MPNSDSSIFWRYQLTVIFSIIFALIGFSYNVWRMELTERNSNLRSASFEMLLELSELEQLVYAAHYDGDLSKGNPRMGWVKVGLIQDLSTLTQAPVEAAAEQLKAIWSAEWSTMVESQSSTNNIVAQIDAVRASVKETLQSLR